MNHIYGPPVFSGPVSRIVPDSGESIRRHLVRPLQADMLLALSYKAADGCATAETCGVRRRFGCSRLRASTSSGSSRWTSSSA